jgi:hypothetical protein
VGSEVQDGGVGDEAGGDETRSEGAELVEAYVGASASASVSQRFAGLTTGGAAWCDVASRLCLCRDPVGIQF